MQCFVLHEVFGVTSKISHEGEHENGNSDCVICLSEPRDTAVLPCRHMCFCRHCAGIVRLQCEKCPVCRQRVAGLLQLHRPTTQTATTAPSVPSVSVACASEHAKQVNNAEMSGGYASTEKMPQAIP